MGESRKYEDILQQIKQCEETIENYRSQKLHIREEAEWHDMKIRNSLYIQERIEEDWRKRNMLGKAEELFYDGRVMLNKLLHDNEENCYENLNQIDRCINENMEKQDMLYFQLRNTENSEDKESEDGENYKTNGDC